MDNLNNSHDVSPSRPSSSIASTFTQERQASLVSKQLQNMPIGNNVVAFVGPSHPSATRYKLSPILIATLPHTQPWYRMQSITKCMTHS